ncbi:MAG: hypothetical protein J6K77_04550 [Ruminococcus sp.]|nr:hypothetical protein [Ruminococcus sp.]
MSENDVAFLRFRQGPVSAMIISLLSLFAQWVNWFALDKLDYSPYIALFTPAILCMMYHFVQLDGGSGSYSRKFIYVFSAVIPLIFAILVTLCIFVSAPDISTFNPQLEYGGTVKELISLYTSRFVLSSMYIVVFGIIDIPILKAIDKRKKS